MLIPQRGTRRASPSYLSRMAKTASLLVFCAAFAPFAYSQQPVPPEPAPLPPPIQTPLDTPYPGTIDLSVSVNDVAHRVLDVHETIPVQPGELTLLYPQWIPGNHSPTGPISELAGLEVSADGKPIPWLRDRINLYAFHIDVPSGVQTIDVKFQYLTPLKEDQGRISFSSNFIDLSWNTVVLYPAGHFSRDIHFAPSITLPRLALRSALEVRPQKAILSSSRTPRSTRCSFSSLRGSQLSPRGSFHKSGQPRLSRCFRRFSQRTQCHTGRAASPPQPGRASSQALRLASLRSLRLLILAE